VSVSPRYKFLQSAKNRKPPKGVLGITPYPGGPLKTSCQTPFKEEVFLNLLWAKNPANEVPTK